MKKHNTALKPTIILSCVFNLAFFQKTTLSKNSITTHPTPSHALLIPYFYTNKLCINQCKLKYYLNNVFIKCISTLIINKSNDILYVTGSYSFKKGNYIQMVYSSKYQIFKLHTVECIDSLSVPVKGSSYLNTTKPMVGNFGFDDVKKHPKHLLVVCCLNLKIYTLKNIKSSAHKILSFFPPKEANFVATIITHIAEKIHIVRSFVTYKGLYVKFMNNALTAISSYDFLSMKFRKGKDINNS